MMNNQEILKLLLYKSEQYKDCATTNRVLLEIAEIIFGDYTVDVQNVEEESDEEFYNSLYLNDILWHKTPKSTIPQAIAECIDRRIYPTEDDHSGKPARVELVDMDGHILEIDMEYIHNYK